MKQYMWLKSESFCKYLVENNTCGSKILDSNLINLKFSGRYLLSKMYRINGFNILFPKLFSKSRLQLQSYLFLYSGICSFQIDEDTEPTWEEKYPCKQLARPVCCCYCW